MKKSQKPKFNDAILKAIEQAALAAAVVREEDLLQPEMEQYAHESIGEAIGHLNEALAILNK
jgi:hypothetical protein